VGRRARLLPRRQRDPALERLALTCIPARPATGRRARADQLGAEEAQGGHVGEKRSNNREEAKAPRARHRRSSREKPRQWVLLTGRRVDSP
jgi:hypothetical protein